jgi:hypothetical protein
MADDILNRINQMTNDPVFTGERIDVAGKFSGIGKALEKAGGVIDAASKAKAKLVEKIAEKSTIPAVRALKSRAVEKPIIATDFKPGKKKITFVQDIKIPENELANQAKIDEILTPVDEVVNPVINEIDNVDANSLVGEPSVVNEASVDVIENSATQTKINISEGMAKEPVITGEELVAGIAKSKEEIAQIRQDEAKLIEASTSDAEILSIKASTREKLLPPEQVFNLAKDGDMGAVLKAISDLAEIDTKRINQKELTDEFLARGFDENFVNNLVTGNLGVSPDVVPQVLGAEKWATDLLDSLSEKIKTGTATDFDKLNATKTIAFHSLIIRSVKGYKTNVAQSLGMLGVNIGDFLKGAEFSIDGLRSEADILSFFRKYENLKGNINGQRNLIDAAATGSLADKLAGVYLGGLISNVKTLGNIVIGDAPRVAGRIIETFGAASFGALRNMIKLGSENKTYFNESLAQLLSFEKGVQNGIKAASFAWKEGYSTIDKTIGRLDVRAKADFFDVDTGTKPIAHMFKSAFNFAASYGGRSVLTISEFSKGIHYQMGVDALAVRRGQEAYDLTMSVAKNEDAAWKAFDDASEEVRVNPPEDVINEAKYWTLEKRPEKGSSADALFQLQSSQNALGRIIKINVPFFTTRINDMIQVLERTPLILLKDVGTGVKEIATVISGKNFNTFSERAKDLGKRIREDINSGDFMKKDMAYAKLTLGSGLIYAYSQHALNGKLTGAGPVNRAERERWLAQGALPFAEVYDVEAESTGLSEQEQIDSLKIKYGDAFNPSIGTGTFAGKIFSAHTGQGTSSAFKAIAGLIVENMDDVENEEDWIDYVTYGASALYQFSLNAPGIQEAADFGGLVPRSGIPNEKSNDKFVSKLTSAATQMFSDSLLPMSAARKQLVRLRDKTKYEYPINPDEDPVISGIVNGFQEFSYGLGLKYGTVKKDIFNRPQERSYAFSNKSIGKEDKAMQIMSWAGVSSRKPEPKIERKETIYIKGEPRDVNISVRLNSDEYEQMLSLANNSEGMGGFDLEMKILTLGNTESWINAPATFKKNHVESEIESAFEFAKARLLDPELANMADPVAKNALIKANETLMARINKAKTEKTQSFLKGSIQE